MKQKTDKIISKFDFTKYSCKINKDSKEESKLKALELVMTYLPLDIFKIFRREYFPTVEFNIKDGLNREILKKKFASFERMKQLEKEKNKLKRENKLQQQSSQGYSKKNKKSKISNNSSLMSFFAKK